MKVTEANFLSLLLAEVPELESVVEEHLSFMKNEMALHLLMSDIQRFTSAAFDSGNMDVAERVLAFLDQALSGDDRVENAVALSFVYNSVWWQPESAAFIAVWPDRLKAEAKRQQNWRQGQST